MRNLSKNDLNNILNGATFLGSGGGGPRSIGKQIIETIGKSGNPVTLASPDEVPDDAWLAIAAGIGSPDAAKGFDASVVTLAYKELASSINVDFSYVMAAEIGAGNSFMPIYVGHEMNIPVVDGAGASRAVPSITMNSFAANDINVNQLMLANHSRKVGLAIETAAEASGPLRAVISDPSFGQVAGIALWAMTGATMKKYIISGTVTMAQKVGAALATASAPDKASTIADLLGGKMIGTGKISNSSETTAGGFDMGQVTVSLDDGADLVILNKNENLIAWRSDRSSPVTIGPDLICYIAADGTPFSNAELITDQQISVVAIPADDEMRNPNIVSAFREALSSIGYPGPYYPMPS